MNTSLLRRNPSSWIKTLALCIIVFSAGIALGYYLFVKIPYLVKKPVVKEPIIGVINIYGYMISDFERELYLNSILNAYKNDSIVGVVLRVDSPGGYATIVEDIYNALKKLNVKKPVIAIIEGIAASGGYYVCLAAEEIYSVPTTFIGNIGLIMRQPFLVIPSEAIIETGPYKHTGLSLKEVPFIAKKAMSNFIGAVIEGRGEKLNTTIEEISLGKLYLGNDALQMGLIDGFGSFLDAVNRVAELTGVTKYKILDLTKLDQINVSQLLGQSMWMKGELISIEQLEKTQLEPLGLYYISPYYVKAYSFIGQKTTYNSPEIFNMSSIGNYNVTTENIVLVDVSHGNLFTYEILGTLWGKMIENNLKISFGDIKTLQELMTIRKPKALIIICPSVSFTPEEIITIREYVSLGGKLIMIYDPSRVSSWYINSLAQEFGFYFSDGYLYDLKNNYGVYRNIVIKKFTQHPLLSNVNELTLFTAAHIYGGKVKLANTFSTTYLSLSDVMDTYTPIAASDNVIAIGDLTFLLDPFHNISDNKIFLENLVQFIKNT